MKKGGLAIVLLMIFVYSCTAREAPEFSSLPELEPLAESQPPGTIEELPLEPEEILSETEPPAVLLPEVPATETIEEQKPCGSFFDAYTRITGGPQDSSDVLESELAALLAARMKENDVGCALLVGVDVTDFGSAAEIRESINYYSSILRQHPGLFTPLLDIDADSASQISVDLITDILREAEGKIDYRGFGEISFVDPGPWKNKKFTDAPLPELIEFFGEREMVVAAHIARGQTSDLKAILTQYPDTKILVHGYPDGLKDLLVRHKNLYYAAELEIMAADGTFSCSSISTSASEVENAFKVYGPIIAAAPDQVVWATNAHSKCHFQPGFYGKLIEFSTKLVEKLPEEHQDKFAWKNAAGLLGR